MDYILITGGMGFIGSHFVDACLQHFPRARIYIWDKMTYAATMRKLPENCTLIKEDICSKKVRQKLETIPFDCVAHFAAESAVGRSFKNKHVFYKTNVKGTQNIITLYKHIVAHVNSACKLLHASTDEVYGEILEGTAQENTKLHPRNPYAKTKAKADKRVQKLLRKGYSVFITRCCNTYGPRQHAEKLIAGNIKRLLLGLPQMIIGKGTAIRQWVYIDDAIQAFMCLLKHKIYGIYNIGTEDFYSVQEVLHMLASVAQKPYAVAYVEDWKQNDARYAVCAKRIQALGWKPQTTFSQGLQQTWNWYKERK